MSKTEEQDSEQTGATTEETLMFAYEAFSRNAGILTDLEQAALHATTVLVAGCGSVGGAIVEPLVRLGVGRVVLADPDVYELHNINRQACLRGDIGMPKPVVLAERARQISPLVAVRTFTEGITEQNVEDALRDVTVVFDGIDNATSPWEKYLLHKYAVERRIPVVAGADLGGQPTLYIFDYRRTPRLGYGMVREADVRSGREFQVTITMLARKLPRDFLPVVQHMAATGAPWPQITYCADGIGVITTRAIVDIAVGRRLPRIVATDIHMLTRRRPQRLLERAMWLPELARTVRTAQRSTPPPPGTYQRPDAWVPTLLRPVVHAIRRAPSRANCQPWQICIGGTDELVLQIDHERRPRRQDRAGLSTFASLGCAVEAAAAVADIGWCPEAGDAGTVAGAVTVQGLRKDYLVQTGLVGMRHTNRRGYDRASVSPQIAEISETCAHGSALHVVDDHRAISAVGDLTRLAVARNIEDATWILDALRWMRGSRREFDWDATGVAIPAVGPEAWLNVLLRAGKRLPELVDRLRSPRTVKLLAGRAGNVVAASGALVLVSAAGNDPASAIEAGRALMAVWLGATAQGLSAHPVSAPAEVQETQEALMATFGCDGSHVPLCVLRVGQARGVPRRRDPERLPLSRILVDARGTDDEPRNS